MNSVNYYNKNAEMYYARTINIDMSHAYNKFLPCLPSQAKILDIGCGGGRDAKYFLNKNFFVTAFDASIEMVRRTTVEINQEVQHLYFHEMSFREEFDGAWACASLLHIPYKQQRKIFEKIYHALGQEGILYASYKYGKEKESFEDREFFNMTEKTIISYLEGLFSIIETWETPYTNKKFPDSSKTWLNLLARVEK